MLLIDVVRQSSVSVPLIFRFSAGHENQFPNGKALSTNRLSHTHT